MSTKEQAVVQRAQRYFNQLRPRSRVALGKLPLVVTLALAALAAPQAWGSSDGVPFVLAGLLVQLMAGAACLLVPWERFGEQAPLAIPFLDLVSLAILRNAPGGGLQGLSALAIFPVIWIAAVMSSGTWALIICFAGPLAIVSPTLLLVAARGVPASASSTILLPVLLFIVAVAIRAATASLRFQERLLRTQQSHLQELLLESQSTERLLATLLDAVNVGIVAVGPDGRPVRSNRRFRELVTESGWSLPTPTQAAVAGLPLFARDRRTPLSSDRGPLQRAAAGESIDDEVVWLGQGRGARALSVVARPVDGPEGGAVVSFGDVTALAGAVEDKAELVRTVAHEFRSPLTAVLGNLDLVLESAPLDPEVRWRLEVAQTSAERLIDLAADLAVSSPDSMPLRFDDADLFAVLTARADAARLSAAAAGVQLDTDLQDPLWVCADPLRVGQVVDNLLSNAIKYSPNGGVVTLSAARRDGWVTVQVSDRGMGISANEREQVFERFFRTAEARRADIPGVGLGLALSRWIAERHGGRLSVESEPGEGSIFTLLLPAREA